jgi:hypothetical protein
VLQDLLQNCMVGRSWHAEHVSSLNLTFISNSFWNKGRKVLKWHVQIYLPCNFEVNFITYFGVITLFSSNFQHFNTFHPLFQKLNCMVGRSWHAKHVCNLNLTFISNSFWNTGRKVLKCWKFDEKREITPKWVRGFTSKLHLFWSYYPFFIKFSTF